MPGMRNCEATELATTPQQLWTLPNAPGPASRSRRWITPRMCPLPVGGQPVPHSPGFMYADEVRFSRSTANPNFCGVDCDVNARVLCPSEIDVVRPQSMIRRPGQRAGRRPHNAGSARPPSDGIVVACATMPRPGRSAAGTGHSCCARPVWRCPRFRDPGADSSDTNECRSAREVHCGGSMPGTSLRARRKSRHTSTGADRPPDL
jgi:hypothetical protein